MTSLRTDRVRAIALVKNKAGVSNEDTIKAAAARLVERVKAMPLVQKNILKYELVRGPCP